MVTLERLHQLVDAVPPSERDTAARVLEALAVRSAVPGSLFFADGDDGSEPSVLRPDAAPVTDISELHGDFWPEDEEPDAFTSAVRAWRREGGRA
jgi:hypothetical protein